MTLSFPEMVSTNLNLLAHNRKLIETQRQIVSELEISLAQTPSYGEVEKAKEVLSNLVENGKEIDLNVRGAALTIYREDKEKNKSINDSVSIAEYTTFEIDKDLAIAWASEHHQKALKLNTAEIKKVAKAGMEVRGVVLGKESRVKIASDLSQYIKGKD